MKKLKYLFIAIFAAALVTSCGDDEEMLADQITASPNFIGFVDGSANVSGIADGSTYSVMLPIYVSGPTYKSLEGSFSATITVDTENSTAIEGTHFTIPNKSVTLSSEGNYLTEVEVVMTTEGIETPLASNPVIAIYLTDASGSGKLVASERRMNINMLFLCPSELAGTYAAEMEYTPVGGSPSDYNFTDVINAVAPGEYRTTVDHHWGSLGVGTPGFTFFDVCDVLTIPGQNLAEYYGNWVEGTSEGVSDTDAGTLYFEYSICFPQGASGPDACRYYKLLYTKQ